MYFQRKGANIDQHLFRFPVWSKLLHTSLNPLSMLDLVMNYKTLWVL